MSGILDWLLGRRADAGATATPPEGRRRRPAARSGTRERYRRHREPLAPTRFGMAELERRLGVPASELRAFRPSYRVHRIPKRSGGQREIHAPDAPTKQLQRRILRRLLGRVPVGDAVHGFERGRSIATNAGLHVGRTVVLRMDLAAFFASTSDRRIRRLFRVLGWDAESSALLTGLTTVGGGLPAGAPTSPRLANIVNARMDARLGALAAALGATYTRYADDLTFSFPDDEPARLHDVIAATKRIVGQSGYRLHEDRKLQIRRRHDRQLVTGLVVNDRVALPRARRRWLRAVEHHLYTGRPATLTREQLAGWHALEHMIATQPARRASTEPDGRAPATG